MRFSSFIPFLFAIPAVLAAPYEDELITRARLVLRDAATVLADLKQCDAIIVQLKKDIDAYTGSGSQVLTINSDIDKLNKCLQQALKDCQATEASSVTAAQATAIINYCNSPLEPDVKAALASLKAKRATFVANGLKPTVQSQLKVLQSNTKALTDCLLSKTPSAQKAAASSCVAKISADITDAINYYA